MLTEHHTSYEVPLGEVMTALQNRFEGTIRVDSRKGFTVLLKS